MTDERKGLPSASETERLELCPASFLRAKNQPDTSSEIAQTGTRIHEAVETGNRDGLTPSEERLADDCARLADVIHDECGFDPDDEATETIKEVRLWLYASGVDRIMSGKPDLVVINGDRALVIDYKTGYLETLEASQNLQLRTLAVMVAVNHEVDEVNVAIVQPNIEPGYSVARYTKPDIDRARRQLIKILNDANDANAVANPGEKQCRYCKAKPVCKEAQEASFSVIEADTTTLDVVRLPELLEKCDLADRVIKSIRDAALNIVKDGGTVAGWEMPEAGQSRSFVSTHAVFNALGDVIPREAFANACDVKLNKLETAWLEATPDDLTKKERLATMRSFLDPVSVYKDKTVRKLRRVKA
jgi:hypothetical protein